MFKCKICNKEMNLIIEGIWDTGCAYYCYDCGTVLETFYKNKHLGYNLDIEEQIKNWFIPSKYKENNNVYK